MNGQNYNQAQGDLITLRRDLEEEKNRHLRTLADFENFRRRVDREALSASNRGKKVLIGDLLDVLDYIEWAMTRTMDTDSLEGLQIIHRRFKGILKHHGLEEVKSVGEPFDPEIHEGIGFTGETGFPQGHVAEEMRRGYIFNGELIRPATVRVSNRQVMT